MTSYLLLKQAHIGLVSLSLICFAARGLGVLAGAAWPMRTALRRATVLVDSLLLAAGLGLWAQLGWAPITWLFAKFGWLLAYILLGTLALRRAHGQRARWLCFLLALLCAAQLVATARAHHPLGLLA